MDPVIDWDRAKAIGYQKA